MNVAPAGRAARSAWGERAAWVVALAAVAAMLALGQYESRDPDSALYAAISADIARRPLPEWIAPEWNGHWALEGLYREHPVGVFILPAVAIRLGYPPYQAAYLVNAIYQVVTLWLMLALGRQFLARRDARLLVTLMLLLPIAFTYRIRANQEQPLLMFLLAALYGIERSRSSLKWAALATTGVAGLFLVKGVFVAIALAAGASWLVLERWWSPAEARPARPWIGLAVAALSLPVLFVAYDAAYASVVGERFFPWYWTRQFGVALATGTSHPVRGALYSFAWYLGRIAWFAAPWTFVALIGLWRGAHAVARPHAGRPRGHSRDGALRGAVLCVVVAGTYLLAFSAFERRADRYIFPVYYFVAAWWAAYGLRLFPPLRHAAWRATRLLFPYEQVVVWFGAVLLAMAAASFSTRSISIW